MATVPAAPAVEHHREPLGIGERRPRLSWKVDAEPGWSQSRYELEFTRGDALPTRNAVVSPDSVLVPWPLDDLRSREQVRVRVRVRGADGVPSSWSPSVLIEAGLLEPRDWRCVPVGPSWPEDPESDDRRPPLVRREFDVPGPVARARLYVTAHGLYEVEINGSRVGREAMAPGWTVYGERLEYQTYDVTAAVREGANAIGAWLGDGWYRGRLGWNGGFRNLYGADVGLVAQLEVDTGAGERLLVATDGRWRASPGPIVSAGNYDGEVYDAREEQTGWSSPGFDATGWTAVRVGSRDPSTLVAPTGPPVRCTDELAPRDVIRTPSGKRVLDFGQNLVGRLRIRVAGPPGATVTLSTAEVLQDGEIYTRPLREAKSTDVYVLGGRGVEEWEPRFTIHGFRYVQVDGWPGDLDAAASHGDLVARVYHTDMERTGWFECSDADVNRLHENVVWGMRGNFVDIPTDCPQRDERVGWTGDIQVFAPTATFLYDCSGMLDSWLRDVAIEQLPDGTVPWYVPVIPAHKMWTPIRPGAVWGDAAVLTPWTLYERFADPEILARQYRSAKAWVDLVDRIAGADHVWDEGFQLGDWLDPSAPVLLSVGRMDPVKRQDLLIDAFAQVRKNFPRAKLLLAGGGSFSTRELARGSADPSVRWVRHLRDRIATHGLGKSVVITGSLTDAELQAAYGASTIFVHPAPWEGFGLVVVEAWLNHRPVVVSRGAGVAELVEDSVNGYTYPPGSVDRMARAIERLLHHPRDAEQMGEIGALVARRCTVQRAAPRLREIFTRAIQLYEWSGLGADQRPRGGR